MRRVLRSVGLWAGAAWAVCCCGGGCPGIEPAEPSPERVPPVFSNVIARGVLVQGQAGLISISAMVASEAGQIESVVADLSRVGGPAEQPLVQATGEFWTFVGLVTPNEGGTCDIEFTAVDDTGLSNSTTTSINVAYDGPAPPVTPVTVKKNLLGGSTVLAGTEVARVYVPSRHGGQLTISGAGVQLIYNDGEEIPTDVPGQIELAGTVVAEGNPCSYAVPSGARGWYYIRPADSTGVTIVTTFVEDGQARDRPWNGWWWAWNSSGGPTLYDEGGPLEKYDRVYGTQAQDWARTYESGGAWWWGHCWGWSIASILVPEPVATTKDGVHFSADDMKALYTALADAEPYIDAQASIDYIPTGPATEGSGEQIDLYCDDVHRILRTSLREDRFPVQGDMRVSDATPPDRADEVWNQAIYRYVATFRQSPGSEDEHVVRVEMRVWANYDLSPPPTDNSKDRQELYVYDLEYDESGEIVANSSKQNWVSTSHYPPAELYRITGSSFAGPNPHLTKARVDGLYQ